MLQRDGGSALAQLPRRKPLAGGFPPSSAVGGFGAAEPQTNDVASFKQQLGAQMLGTQLPGMGGPENDPAGHVGFLGPPAPAGGHVGFLGPPVGAGGHAGFLGPPVSAPPPPQPGGDPAAGGLPPAVAQPPQAFSPQPGEQGGMQLGPKARLGGAVLQQRKMSRGGFSKPRAMPGRASAIY